MFKKMLSAAFWRFCRAMFDRRLRVKKFFIMSILIFVEAYLLDYASPRYSNLGMKIIFYVLQWTAFRLLAVGWTLALVSECLASVFDNSPDTVEDFSMALDASYVLDFASVMCDLMWVISAPSTANNWEHFIHHFTVYYFLTWSFGIVFGSVPIDFLVRTTPDDHPNPQYMHLLVWCKMDLCQIMPAPMPPNAAYFGPAPLPIYDWLWPSINELPPWISMKMSQSAAAPG